MIQGELAVFGLPAVVDAEGLFETAEACIPAAQHTGHVGADLDVIGGFGFLVEHGVEGDDRADFGGRLSQHFGQFVLRLNGTIAVFALDNV